MKLNKLGLLVLISILLGSILLIIGNGSSNTPIEKQKDYGEVSLTDDPDIQQNPFPFNFDFELPSIDIPFISGTLGLGDTGIGIIIFIFILMVILLITSIVFTKIHKKKRIKEDVKDFDGSEYSELEIRRLTLGKRIDEIKNFLHACLDGRYSQGITEGFERLDSALKEYSKISRPGWLTPREFTLLKIPYFNHDAMLAAVEQFYRVTYGQRIALRKELEEYIVYFERMITNESVLKWKADSPPILESIK